MWGWGAASGVSNPATGNQATQFDVENVFSGRLKELLVAPTSPPPFFLNTFAQEACLLSFPAVSLLILLNPP